MYSSAVPPTEDWRRKREWRDGGSRATLLRVLTVCECDVPRWAACEVEDSEVARTRDYTVGRWLIHIQRNHDP